MRLVTPSWPAGSDAVPPTKEKDSDTAGALLSCTSQALMPSGVVTALMSTAPAAAGSNESATTSAARMRNTGLTACLPAGSAPR